MFSKINWRELENSEIEREYSPSSTIGGNYLPYINEYIRESNLVKESYDVIECSYGPLSTNTLDLILPKNFLEGALVPLIVFIHGGYWQELSKNESLNEKLRLDRIKGIEPKSATAIHAKVENRKVCFRFN